MAFATTILDKQAARGFGIVFDLYNAATADTITISCSPSRAFQPTYQPSVLEVSQPTFELRFGKPMSKLSDFTWAMENGPCQAGAAISHERLSDLFANGYVAIGQTVKLRALVVNGSTTESAEVWRGHITDCKWDLDRVEFTAIHQVVRALETIIPATAVTKTAYPEAPNESIGAPLPIVLGDWSVDPADSGEDATWNKKAELMGLAALDRLLPTLCTDTNISDKSTGPVFHLAGHASKSCPTSKSESVFFYVGDLQGHAVCDPGGFTITNSGITKVAFGANPTIRVVMRPDGVEATSTALTPLNAFDKSMASYASINAVGANPLVVTLPRPPDLGYIKSVTVYAYLAYSSLSGAERLEVGLWDYSGAGAWYGGHSSVATPAVLDFETHAVTGVTLKHVDEFPDDLAIRIIVASYSSAVVNIGEVAMVVEFQPTFYTGIDPTGAKASLWQPRLTPNWSRSERFPDFTATASLIFMSSTGIADTAGMYTGSGTDLIERPCDMIMYLASARAGLSPLTSGHGSFATARTDIDAIGLTGRVYVDKQTVIGDLMSRLAEESLCGMVLTATSLGLVFWGSAASDNLYAGGPLAGPIDGNDLMACEIGQTSLDEIRNAVYAQCGYHANLKKCKHMAYCDKDGSDNGAGVADFPATGAVSKASLAASEAAYGRKEFHLNCEHLRVAEISHIRDYYAAMLQEPRVTLRFTVPWAYYDLQVGHVIEVDDTSWQALGLKYPGTTDGVAGYWSHGAVTRYFWVERVTYNENGTMEIEASEGVWP
jgi:hypothetical protein